MLDGNRHRVGMGSGGLLNTRDDPGKILRLAQYSPQIALAIVEGATFAPYLANIRASFVDATNTLNPVSFDTGNLSQCSVCDSIEYEIDAPNAFPGTQLKPFTDYFYGLQSGIQATLLVGVGGGAPRYAVADTFTPLRSLLHAVGDAWPDGWVLQYNQTVVMQFQQTMPVPTYPTNITVTFRLWMPAGTDRYFMMDTVAARSELKKNGWNVQWPLQGPQAGANTSYGGTGVPQGASSPLPNALPSGAPR